MRNHTLAIGFRPSFEAIVQEDGSYVLTITPSKLFSSREKVINLTASEYERGFCSWLEGYKTIQQAFPDFTPEQREVFITGMDEEDYE